MAVDPAIFLLYAPVSLFWATYEQQGNTITLWADQFTDRRFLGWEIPVTWFQAFNPFMIFAFTPFVVSLWRRQNKNEPATATKLAIGCLINSLAYLIMVAAALSSVGEKASWLWLLAVFRCHYRWRALSLADESLPDNKNRAGFVAVDDDGRVALDQLRRRISRRLPWNVLVEYGKTRLLPDARPDFSSGRSYNRIFAQPS